MQADGLTDLHPATLVDGVQLLRDALKSKAVHDIISQAADDAEVARMHRGDMLLRHG